MITRNQYTNDLLSIKERLNSDEKKLSDFSEMLKAQADIAITDLEIAQIENEQATTDLEIAVLELQQEN